MANFITEILEISKTSIPVQTREVMSTVTEYFHDILLKRDLYGFELSRPGNVIFLVVFFCVAVFNIFMAFRSKQVWYSVCFICGFGLEAIGYVGRVLGFINSSSMGYYIIQSFCLTIAPAFLMAGIYFLFAQTVAIHGRQYSLLRPMWYSYFFIGTDVLSILVQGGGGGLAAQGGDLLNLGNTLMLVGILIQIIAMTIFLGLWFIFLGRIFFHDRVAVPGNSAYKHRGFMNYIKLVFNVSSADAYKREQLDRFYNPQYQSIRARSRFSNFPLAVSLAVVLVYIRCVYRVVELKEGYRGYLMTHEVYLFVLDSALIAVTGLIFIPFHPAYVFGRDNVLTSKDIKKCQFSLEHELISYPQAGRLDNESDFTYAAQKRQQYQTRTQL